MNSHPADFSSNGFCSEASMQNNLYSRNHGQQIEIQKQLEKTFDQFFNYFNFLVIIGTSISALRIRETGLLFSYPLQWFCVLMLLLVVLFKRKIPFQNRVVSLWILGIIFGAIGIFAHGLLGQGFLVLLLCCMVATIGGRRLHGYIVSGLSCIVTITAGIAFYQGWLAVHVNPSTYLVSIVPWITAASAITVISLLVTNFLGSVKELWLKNINMMVLNETKYRLLFESAADSIFIMQEDKFIDCNQKALDIFRCTREQLLGETPYRFSPEKQPDGKLSSEKAHEKLSAALSGEPQFFEWAHFRYDGTPFEAEVSLNKLNVGNESFVQAITRDITKRKNAERELQKKERQQSLILHSLPMAFYIAQPFDEYGVTWVSEQIEEITGFSSEQLITDKGFWASKLHPEDKQRTIEIFDEILDKEIIEPVYRWQIADGSYKWFRDVAALIRNDDGKPKEIVGAWVDITEHKQMQVEKETLEAQLRQAQKMEAIGTLAGGIAHDFNNILTPILLHTEMSLLELPADSTVRRHLEEVKEAGLRATDLVKQILDFSRKSEQERIPLQFNNICKEVIKFIRASIPTTIKIKQDLRDKSYVLADPVQMHQVLMNLCTNAAHAMQADEKGLLELNLAQTVISKEDLSSLPDLAPGTYLKLSIRDTGYGMTTEVQQRIFDPFFSTKERGEGTGLGLSVVHGILASHNGMITVESEPDQGSTFTVYLPVQEKVELRHSKKNEPLPCGSEKILLVDDEVKLVEANKEILNKLGYEVFDFTNPHDCLEMFKEEPMGFDLVISDLAMPGMTGIVLIREILKTRPNMPAILITGYIKETQKAEIKALGLNKVIHKPVTMSKMAVTIREALENI